MFSKLKERLSYLFFDRQNDWQMGFSLQPIQAFLNNDAVPEMKWFPMPRNMFRADTFGISRDNKHYIFYEEYDYTKRYGMIGCVVLDQEFNELDRKLIFDDGHHYSFPVVFEYEGEMYMMPETLDQGKLSLYKAVSFPFEWKEEHVMLELPCIDSVVFFRDGFWWLIYSNEETGNGVFYVRKNAELMGDWKQCKEQKIEYGPYNSRGGGSVFESGGELYRVTQNCTDSYGQAVVINRIVNLSDTDYREEAVKEITAVSLGFTGFHTLSEWGPYTLVDKRAIRLYPKSPGKIIGSLLDKVLKRT
jgi:hypothetical protein